MESLSQFRKPPSRKTLGIEWEMLWDEDHPNYHRAGKHLKFFYITSDGSITTSGVPRLYCFWGRELVSQPLTYAWLLKELERLNEVIPTPHVNESCGIHVHVSRQWATPKKVDHLVDFLRTLTNSESLDSFGREPNTYCASMSRWFKGSDSRYWALNLTRKDTIEFRVFRSGDVKWAQYCVKLVNYMMENATRLNKDAFFAFVDMEKP